MVKKNLLPKLSQPLERYFLKNIQYLKWAEFPDHVLMSVTVRVGIRVRAKGPKRKPKSDNFDIIAFMYNHVMASLSSNSN